MQTLDLVAELLPSPQSASTGSVLRTSCKYRIFQSWSSTIRIAASLRSNVDRSCTVCPPALVPRGTECCAPPGPNSRKACRWWKPSWIVSPQNIALAMPLHRWLVCPEKTASGKAGIKSTGRGPQHLFSPSNPSPHLPKQALQPCSTLLLSFESHSQHVFPPPNLGPPVLALPCERYRLGCNSRIHGTKLHRPLRDLASARPEC